MKILQIFGAVVAVHLLAFIFIFASPGCQGSPRNVPTPDATVPTASAPSSTLSYSSGAADPAVSAPADFGSAPVYTPGRAAPTRPGSPNAVAITPAKVAVEDVAPVSTYTVQKGDSLWSIAKKNHLTVAELAKANSLGASTPLQPGKKLIIPGKPGVAAQPKDLATAPASAAEKPAAPAPGNGEAVKHTVLAGESLGTIARKYQVTVGELAAANNITDPAKIRVGQTLAIPGFKAVGAKKSAPKPAAPVTTPAAADKPAIEPAPASVTPHFEIKAPPPGQDLDAGLKDNTATDVPTIKVEEPAKPEEPPKK